MTASVCQRCFITKTECPGSASQPVSQSIDEFPSNRTLDGKTVHTELSSLRCLFGHTRSPGHRRSIIIIHSFVMSTNTINEYDLSGVVSGYLDKHLVFPLLEFLSQKKLYDVKDIETSKLEVVEKTNMVDYAVDIHQQLYQTDEVRAIGPDNNGRGDGGPQLVGRVDVRLLSFFIHVIFDFCSLICRYLIRCRSPSR